ncbi:hypothetical protein J0383_11320 [Flavobacterium endoglycinae]|uniref:Uncharacterized protein n=1 Tax=Flavobacterium endoglycinae TaxID=2816357 RepID=A0ABX7QJU9_9FLAO|nr:hypothetical protein [Flavobacterium endoglycinae]QSW91367.1 hypothetical protein J0383_11320 [Flavobacterium endoglycinae]
MALSTKKYLLPIIFLVAPLSISLYAQSTEKPTVSGCEMTSTAVVNQNNELAVKNSVKLDNSNQFMVGLSIPKDSLTVAAEKSSSTSEECEENTFISSTSILAKDIIENYKYDFSETFIDILFFERIDLARTRTI